MRYRDFFLPKLGKTFKVQSGTLNCNFQVVPLLKCKYVENLLLLVKQKRNLKQDLIITKVHRGPIEKTGKCHSSVSMNIMGKEKERKHFCNTGLKHFTLMGFMKRKNVYIKSLLLTSFSYEYISYLF